MSASACRLDTSVVMRCLVGAPVAQFRAAVRFLEEQKAMGASIQICDLVISEAYFALQSFYSIPKDRALRMLEEFCANPAFSISGHTREILALPNLATVKPGFVDRLIHADSFAANATLVTFEKSTAKLPGTLVLDS